MTFQPNTVKGKRIIIVLDMEVLSEYGELDKIGEPVALDPKPEDDDQKPQPATIAGNSMYGGKPAQPSAPAQPQSRSLPSRAGATSSSTHGNLYPIEALSPYAHKWTIKVRCTSKTNIKTWHKNTGQGKLFSVNLLDDSGEIRATAFNDQVDTLYEVFQEGGVYYISSPCAVKFANKKFTNLNNEYELTFERDTMVEKCEDQGSVPEMRFNFTPIGNLDKILKDSTIDTIGILKEVGEVSDIVSKTTAKPFSKRDLTLVDDTLHSIRLTIWGNAAKEFSTELESVIAFKGVKVSDFGGRSLSLLSSGTMSVEPDIDEAHKLKGWYQAQGASTSYQTHAHLSTGQAGGPKNDAKTIAQVREEGLGMSEEDDFFTVKGSIIYIKQENFAYPSCLSEGCNKKVVENVPGQWQCERCDRTHPRPEWRYIISASVNDHTGQLYLSGFDNTGRQLMGMDANELVAMKDEDEKKAQEVFIQAIGKTMYFRCRAKMETYQNEPK